MQRKYLHSTIALGLSLAAIGAWGGQLCQLANASGSMDSANVGNFDVSCGSNALIRDQGIRDDSTWQQG